MESAKTKRWMWAGASSIAAGLLPLLLTVILQRGWWVPWALLLVIGGVEIAYGLLVGRHSEVRADTNTEIRM
ncbi:MULTISPECIES: hypothetical protein [Actinotignum]|uniref:hypothetical protein n=1 Tax=Actinotignum TaxID=1653174 RepID=UPI00041E7CAC|nr:MULTISPECIES: hypothetical protein [Actinotignum]AIE83326.1 hypothetical protein FB03_08890 [Actinotignum schaalii]MDY5137831.1 hypothetical protein [Actinotignum timonense]WQN45540.1 hypothetical protein U4A90_02250 [Actinotignum schaalii]